MLGHDTPQFLKQSFSNIQGNAKWPAEMLRICFAALVKY